jgi:undecaprenyl diphosphate synthase
MDGNGRWANARGLKRNAGHEAGETALFDTVEGALDLGIEYLTVYAFSTENWKRSPEEVRFLMNFNESLLLGAPTSSTNATSGCASSAGASVPVPRGWSS